MYRTNRLSEKMIKGVIEKHALNEYHLLRSSLEKPHTLTLALSPQGRGDLRIAPPLRGGDKGEGEIAGL